MKSIPFNDATLSISIKPRANIISNDILSHKSYEMFLKELGCEAQSIASFVLLYQIKQLTNLGRGEIKSICVKTFVQFV